jgi:undecaprenyl-phosphate 4-deoxy-4-formamido-L-arabinose transferase
MNTPRPDLSVVVPVYNSEGSLRALAARLEPILREHAGEFELILVNDGSRDGSWRVVQELAQQHPWIRGLDLMRNYGQHNALLCGIRVARFDLVLTMDDDLQHPPEEVPKLLKEFARGFDVVYGTPAQEPHGFLRSLASRMTKLALQKSMGADTARKVSAFRVLRTNLREGFADFRGQFVSIDVLLTWSTTRFAAVEVRHDPREIGASNYTYRKLFVHALNMITGFLGRGRVASVYGAMRCAACDAELDHLFDRTDCDDGLPPVACPRCGSEMELDDAEDQYLLFLREPTRMP